MKAVHDRIHQHARDDEQRKCVGSEDSPRCLFILVPPGLLWLLQPFVRPGLVGGDAV